MSKLVLALLMLALAMFGPAQAQLTTLGAGGKSGGSTPVTPCSGGNALNFSNACAAVWIGH